METGTTEGHRHHLNDLSIFDCSVCPECRMLFFTGGDDGPETCVHCDVELESVRLDCEPRAYNVFGGSRENNS